MFEPSPVLLAFLVLKSYLYLLGILVLASLRLGAGRGTWVRVLAGLAAGVAITGLAARFGPPLAGLYAGSVPMVADRVAALGGGMALPLLASAGLALSALPRPARWRGIDIAHAVLFAALAILWAVARW